MLKSLQAWIEAQFRFSGAALMRSISCGLTKTRAGFAQSVTARKGSVVASPVLASYDPDPDYFFHWFRDSAIVIDALRLLRDEPRSASLAQAAFADFVAFSRSLQNLDGSLLVQSSAWRGAVAPGFRQYLRSDADLGAMRGAAVSTDTRVNPDGTLDISSWPRPQFDGPALRALTLMRWLSGTVHDTVRTDAEALLQADLAVTASLGRGACFDIWEEEKGFHYYTWRVAAAALSEGAAWLDARHEAVTAARYRGAADEILASLDSYWLDARGYYRSRVLESGQSSAKELDIAVVLSVLHADARGERHSPYDPRMHATLEKLALLFDTEYPLNRQRPRGHGPAMGRYANDLYYSGGPYFFSTLGAAEFCYRAALKGKDAADWRRRGDAFLVTARQFTPPDGELPEQFDRQTGLPRSARQLAWSHAAFLSCVHARRLT